MMKNSSLSFYEQCYEVLKKNIVISQVTSYGAIAKYLGAARSSRMVRWAMNQSHTRIDFPSHIVVNRQGILTGKHHFLLSNLIK